MSRARRSLNHTLLLTACACNWAHGQENAATIPEVIVSAERTDTLERTTPVSIGVVGRGEIERKGIADLHDLVGVVAGVAVPNGFSNMPQAVAIRGIGASNAAMSQAVGIYIDDVPLLRGYATGLWDLPDIERIEVLRGPQGTLYGQNSTGGAVRFVTRDPSADTVAWLAWGSAWLCPLLMLLQPAAAGAWQRAMFATVGLWLWRVLGSQATQRDEQACHQSFE